MKSYRAILNLLGRNHALGWLIVLFFADAVALITAFLAAYSLRNTLGLRFLAHQTQSAAFYINVLPLCLILFWIIGYHRGLYQHRKRVSIFDELSTVFSTIGLWMLFLLSTLYLLHNEYSRAIVLLGGLCALLFILILRFVLRRIRAFGYKHGIGIQNALIICTSAQMKAYENSLRDYFPKGSLHIQTVTVVRSENTDQAYAIARKSILEQMPHIVFMENGIISPDHLLTLITESDPDIDFRVTADIFKLLSSSITHHISSIPAASIRKRKPTAFYFSSKRAMDIVLSLAALIGLSPLFFIIFVGIKWSSVGPTYIAQRRVGKGGQPFFMYKFRTMHTASAEYQQAPSSPDDQRVFPFGRWLRRTSLDELPQFFNVLRGEMSLVGPRPEMEFIVRSYNNWQRKRLDAKPGLTGLWQIYGRKDIPLTDNLEYDFYYINNQSILLDCMILCKTIPAVLLQKGAY